jgi:hypothetical protein
MYHICLIYINMFTHIYTYIYVYIYILLVQLDVYYTGFGLNINMSMYIYIYVYIHLYICLYVLVCLKTCRKPIHRRWHFLLIPKTSIRCIKIQFGCHIWIIRQPNCIFDTPNRCFRREWETPAPVDRLPTCFHTCMMMFT